MLRRPLPRAAVAEPANEAGRRAAAMPAPEAIPTSDLGESSTTPGR